MKSRIVTPLIVLVSLLAILACVSAASALAAEAPRWDIVSTSNPTNLVPNTPVNEVQNVTVNALVGTFTLTVKTALCGGEDTTGPIPVNATHEVVQAELEEGCGLPGNVTVTGGPGGSSPYVVTFVNEAGDQPVPLMTGDGSPGGAATVTVTQVRVGAVASRLIVTATNVGGAATDGSTITLSDSLPPGLIATTIVGYDSYASGFASAGIGGAPMSCSAPTISLSCTYAGRVDPGDSLVMVVTVSVEPSGLPPEVANEVSVSGGAAAGASVSTPVTIGDMPSGFGLAPGSAIASISTSQAGAHPNATAAFTLDESESNIPAARVKDLSGDLPPGLVGNTVGMPRCTMNQVLKESVEPNACPRDTMVGIATVLLGGGETGPRGGPISVVVPVYNIAPAPGEPAAFGFKVVLAPVRLDTSVLSDGDYGVRVTGSSLNEGAEILASSITLWGVPADHSGPGSNGERSYYSQQFGGPNLGQTRVPLLTNPSQCSEHLSATALSDSWANPGAFVSQEASTGTLTGCAQLSLESSFSMLPDTREAGAPAGYSFDLSVPQNNEPEGLATPDVKRVVATLPSGTVISPSAADGLGDCTNEQFFGSGPREAASAKPGECPRDSQVGTVRIKSPALEERLTGDVYLATPLCTGVGGACTPQDAADGRMVRLFVQVVGEGESGIVVKLEGTGLVNQQTGQLTTTFNENPQLPFSEFQLILQGGERATLANPRTCGSATTTLDLTPWSTPFTPDATPTSTFDIDENCFAPQFNPSFSAGTTSNQAGGFSSFTLAFGRSDSDEFLNGLQVQMPPGLLGMLSRVALCPEPQASQGTCGPESLIGEATVETGPGADPFLVTGGKVFITGPYRGAPYGLSIVVPAKAGPYTLSGTTGNGTVVNRSAISVNPETSALTVTADPLPTVLDGIPLQLRLVDVTINRPGFIFNSTSCNKLQIGATLTSTEAASASGSSSYQVTNCGALTFKPKFTVSTSGKTSRANGASLDAKLTFPTGSQTNHADIHSFKVDLPKQLPSRLTTLQKACVAAVFEANPANCPAASVIGTVRVNTPVLPVQLTGPVYFVSHGGEAFPSLEIVLQGDGVRVDVIASTFISKAGITSSTFKTVPDVPFESFELYLPEGKYSALAANGTLCTSKLAMPTAITAQNGAEIHESTPIAVTGCPKAKQATTKKKKKTKKKGKKASNARKSSHGQGARS
jgi:hypothetical protein